MGHAASVRRFDGNATGELKERGRTADQAGRRRGKRPSRKRRETYNCPESWRLAGAARREEAIFARRGGLTVIGTLRGAAAGRARNGRAQQLRSARKTDRQFCRCGRAFCTDRASLPSLCSQSFEAPSAAFRARRRNLEIAIRASV